MLMGTLPHELDFPGGWSAELVRRAPRFQAWMERVVQVPNVSFDWDEKTLAQLKAKLESMAANMADKK